MMQRCNSCDNELSEEDRFCGECGAAVILPDEPRSEGPSMGELVPARSARLRRIAGRVFLVASLLVGVSAVSAGAYYLLATEAQQGAIIRFAMREGIGLVSDEPSPEATETPTEEASEEPTEEASETPTEAATTAAAEPAQAQMVIQPGNWNFSMSLVNVTKANPADTTFELSRQGIGASEASSMCVTENVASNPSLTAFPLPTSLDCRPSSLVMAGGRYGASMTCNFPQYGGRRPLDVTGQYSSDSISLTTRVRVPSDIVSGDFARTPEIVLHYRITGRRTGGC